MIIARTQNVRDFDNDVKEKTEILFERENKA